MDKKDIHKNIVEKIMEETLLKHPDKHIQMVRFYNSLKRMNTFAQKRAPLIIMQGEVALMATILFGSVKKLLWYIIKHRLQLIWIKYVKIRFIKYPE